MRRVLITGGAGYLGAALLRGAPAGVELHATMRRSLPERGACHVVELAEEPAVRALWERVRPDLVIHTAYSMADQERDIWLATRAVTDASRAVGAALVHLSSDTVFDGEHAPYAEDAAPSPVFEYGRWKARAEEYVRESFPAAAIVRAPLLTSFSPLDPRSAWIADGLRREAGVKLFTDEIRCPIGVDDIAAQIWEIGALGEAEMRGAWHLAGPEALSRYAIGLLVAALLGVPPDRLVPTSSADGPTRRPRDLRLLTARADAMLRTRPRPISALAAEARVERGPRPATD